MDKSTFQIIRRLENRFCRKPQFCEYKTSRITENVRTSQEKLLVARD